MVIAIGVFGFLLLNGNGLVQASAGLANMLQKSALHDAESGQYVEAENLYTKEISLLLAGGKRSEAGAVYIDLAELSHVQGVFPLAEDRYKQGIDLLRRYGQRSDDRLVRALDGLGWLYVTWGRDLDALRTMDEAREAGDQAQLSPSLLLGHLDTQAAFLSVTNRYSEAQREWKRALEVKDANYGPNSPIHDVLLLHSGQASAVYHDYNTAQQLFLRYIGIEDRASNGPSISRAAAAAELGHVDVAVHNLPQARHWFDQAMRMLDRTADQAPLVFSMVLGYQGDFYMAEKHWVAAEGDYRRALAIREKVLGDNNYAAAMGMIALSGALEKLHRKGEAKAFTARANSILAAAKSPLQNQVDVRALRGQ
jgi:tetratricopeptide (TPR) repeat protein